MGHQVVYCDKCGRMLREEEFLRGKAHTFENRSYCVECRPPTAAVPSVPLPTSTPRAIKAVSSTRIPQQPATGRVEPASATPSRKTLYIGLAGTTLILVVAAMVLLSGGKGNRGEVEVAVGVNTPAPAPSTAAGPVTTTAPSPGPASSLSVVEQPAKEAYLKVQELRKTDPNNLAALYGALDQIVKKYPTAAVTDQARREVKEIEQRWSDEIGQLYGQTGPLLTAEDYKSLQEFWSKARARYDAAGWTSLVDEKIKESTDLPASRFVAIRARAADAKRINAPDEVKKYRDRIVGWGLPKYVDDFDKTLAEIALEKPDKPELAPAVSTKEGASYFVAWKEAMDLAAQRDYEGAAVALQKASSGLKEDAVKANAAADAEALKLAAAACAEGKLLLAKVSKGQKMTFVYFDEAGARASVEGAVACTDGQRIEVRKGEENVVVMSGEIGAATLADLYRSRPGKKPEDVKAAAFLCVIEGDLESARKMGVDPPLPDRYVALAGEVEASRKNVDPKEAEARKIFFDAEGGFLAPARTLDAIKAYKSLLSGYATTAFVRRNKGAISMRTDGGKEYVFVAADLAASNAFKLGKFNNVDCWMSTKDVDAASMKDHYVQIDFSAHADLDYHLWVQVGGCCQEVQTVHVQGTDLHAPNPKKMAEMIAVPIGGDAIGAVKMPYSSLKKKHADHTGPKQPDKWEWVPIPLPKFREAGAKSVRLLTTQKGFSVAAVVLTQKTTPPRDADIKEAERARAEIPGYAYYRAFSETGGILREWWTDIQGTAIAELKAIPAFPDKPSGSAVETSFKAPRDWADNYGTRMRGWVHPPVTGNYIFWLTSDDQGELWLSSDDRPDPKLLRKICDVPVYAGPDEWTKYGSQKSPPIPLVAGKRYYIEAYQKEGGGGDHLTVKWNLPDGTEENPIPGNRLSPWGGKRK